MARHPALDPSGLARATLRLSSLIPGYSGYQTPERSRAEDRVFRDAVNRQLGILIGRLERALGRCLPSLPSEDGEAVSAIPRALRRHRDRIRFAPQGGSSLLAQKEIQLAELEGLVTLDAMVWSVLEEIDRLAGVWDEDSRRGKTTLPADDLREVVLALEDTLDQRESYLRS